ncbi:hypothetical protein [Ruminococcus sp.]|uniref:hypothetical protein n=1 Tax=Ruminococcus sp. TaxID=41978 RepID=UPI001B3E96F6|nr:hypothetical protein [Ruminococcus sp.]MBP5432210.1 hypothetical protein [Ruminococcus sp.]
MYDIFDVLSLAAKNKAESNKAKNLLKLALSDLEDSEDCDNCIHDSARCPGVTDRCQYKWKHYDEAMQLLGEEKK